MQSSSNLIKVHDIFLYYETFGDPNNIPILLIQGSSAQCILWPDIFCTQLALNNYYVIRYDHRDTGKSSYINYNDNSYSLNELALDIIYLFNNLNIKKAHIIGSSMGGYIAQLLGIYYPDRVLSLTLMMTSTESMSLEHAFLSVSENDFPLPLPSQEFLDNIISIKINGKDNNSIANYLLAVWDAYNGRGIKFDKILWYQVAHNWIKRSTNLKNANNHRFAISNSAKSRNVLLKNIQNIPCLIIHGSCDPFFDLAHAHYLNQIIANSKLQIIENMGHLFHEAFIQEVLSMVLMHCKLS